MKVGYFADGPWGHNALDLLVKDKSISVEFVAPRFDFRDEVLVEKAKEYGCEVVFFDNVNSKENLKIISSFKCDLLISMSFNQIIKKDLIDLSKLGFINCHAGKLPEYRGRNILNWALINNEDHFGITVHYVDTGIDTGDIIHQEIFPIESSDTYNDLLETSYEECPNVLFKAVKDIQNKKSKRIPQVDIGIGFYCGMRGPGDEWINWNDDSLVIYNFIRAITLPGCCAHTSCRGKIIKIISSELVKGRDYIGSPGQVVGKNENGIIVKTLNSTILISKIEVDGEIKIPSYRIGTRFVNKVDFILEKNGMTL